MITKSASTLRRTLIVLMLSAGLVAAAIVAAAISIYEQTTFKPRAAGALRQQADTLAAVVLPPLEFNDTVTATQYLDTRRDYPDIVAAALYAADGRRVATYVRSDALKIAWPEKTQSDGHVFIDGKLHLWRTVSGYGKTAGYLFLCADVPPLFERLPQYGIMAGAVALALIAASLVLLTGLGTYVLRPLRAITATTERVTHDKSFDARAAIEGNGELARLAAALNEMLETIQTRDHQLRSSESRLRKRSEQQSVVVRLGLEALSAPNLDSVLQRAADAASDALGADFTAIYEVQADRTTARLQAGSGWEAGLVGRATISIDPESPAGRTLTHQTPVLIDDVTAEPTFPISNLHGHASIRSLASVAIRGNGRAWGFIAAYGNSARSLGSDDISVLQEVANLVAQAIQRVGADVARRAAEAQLLQSQKMEALGRLAGGIAHDFNNLLSAILGNAQLAKEDVGAAHRAIVSLEEIQRAGHRSKELVQRILAFSRNQEPRKEFVRLQPIVEEVGRLLRATIPAQIEIAVQAEADAPGTMADSGQVHQCLLNLATNAWQAIGPSPGRIALRLRYEEALQEGEGVIQLRPGRYLRIDVEDNGGGMDERTREHIFEPFFTTKPLGEGTGLGLSMVHGIMESHGGAIEVRSEIGQGSTFSLYFPILGTSAGMRTAIQPTAAAAAPTKGMHVLYIDDEEPLVFLATRLLERLGYRVSGYTHADLALKAFNENPDAFDLIVTDLSMPGLSGMDVARSILAVRPDARVVLASGYLRQSDIDAAKSLGIREVILKPNTIEALGPIVHRLLTRS